MTSKVSKPDQEWRAQLTPEQYAVCRQKGTEAPFTGRYYDYKGGGVFRCACCGHRLFDASTKYESGTGWPSFWQPISAESVATEEDLSHSMHRTEVLCANCQAHLGHVFSDGPQPTGLRYCINSVALDLDRDERSR